MRPCAIGHQRLAPSQLPGCRLKCSVQRPCRGAPLVCRTAAPTWAEPTAAARPSLAELEDDMLASTSGIDFQPELEPFKREEEPTRSPPSITDTGTLRPSAEWYPQWMQYRRREDNYVFWQDKFMRCSTDIPWYEKRWTVFSTFWYLAMRFKFHGIPPALRFVWFLAWRGLMFRAYAAHKALVLWQCKLDAALASRGSSGRQVGFSRTMALRRLHWRNSALGELMYAVNLYKTGRIHLLPPVAKPVPRPTFFWLF
ncbi:hypothetical protein Agub_g5412 [Astrephomene gubernaculifera]|uniref:Uncharacterized protein n=1 Tax=Astrephomene gubernaculifera TaxID=47775 RepID=A0AAD3HKN8_9CHLO|nr:hypothetical protein Agub_g5412 [Astrephomene gubernaculifera]